MSSLARAGIDETWLSLVERLLREQEVAGSNPVVSILEHKESRPAGRDFLCFKRTVHSNSMLVLFFLDNLAERIVKLLLGCEKQRQHGF